MFHNSYNAFVDITEKVFRRNITLIFNEFFFFCTFVRGFSNEKFILSRLLKQSGNQQSLVLSLKVIAKSIVKLVVLIFKGIKDKNKEQLITGSINGNTEILICTWLHKASIMQNDLLKKDDSYFGSLGASLETAGYHIQFLCTPASPVLEKEMSEQISFHNNLVINRKNIQFKIRYLLLPFLEIPGLLFSGLSFDEVVACISGLFHERYLFSKELYTTTKSILKNTKIRYVIIPWESQPEQKAVSLACKENNIKVMGYCHSTIVSSFTHIIDNKWPWSPDSLIMNGIAYETILDRMGWKGRWHVTRSLRYKKQPQKHDYEGKVFLPYDIEESISSLQILKSLVIAGQFKIKEIRCHPDNKNQAEIGMLINEIPLSQDATQVIVGGFTSVIFEALQAGCIVYNIQNNPLFSLDAFVDFNRIKVTKLNENLMMFEPVGDNQDYFFCFDDNRNFQALLAN